MYLHIGNDYVIDSKNVIGIFNIDIIKKNGNNKIIRICDDNEKSIVLYKKENQVIEYITNISTSTLVKRVNMYS